MGVYSEKLTEEAKKNKIDISKKDFSSVDTYIEGMLKKVQEEQGMSGTDIREISSSILLKMEMNVESFLDANGNITLNEIGKTVGGIITDATIKKNSVSIDTNKREQIESFNKKDENLNSEKNFFEKLQLNDIGKFVVFGENDDYLRNVFLRDGEGFVGILEELKGENKQIIDENAMGLEGIAKEYPRLLNALGNEEDVKQVIDDMLNNPEISPEKKEIINNLIKKGLDYNSIGKVVLKESPEEMKAMLNVAIATHSEKIIKEMGGKLNYSEKEIKRILMADGLSKEMFEKIDFDYISLEDAIRYNKLAGGYKVKTEFIKKINSLEGSDEIKKFCKENEIIIEDEGEVDLKNLTARIIGKDGAAMRREMSGIIEKAVSMRQFADENPNIQRLLGASGKSEFTEILKEYGYDTLGITFENFALPDSKKKIYEYEYEKYTRNAESHSKNKEATHSQDEEVGRITAASTMANLAQHINKGMFLTEEQIKGANKIYEETAELIFTERIVFRSKDHFERALRGEKIPEQNFKELKRKNISRVYTRFEDIEQERELSDLDIEKSKKFDQVILKVLSKDTEKMNVEKLQEIVSKQMDFEDFKHIYMRKLLNEDINLDDKEFERVFNLKNPLMMKDEIYDLLTECANESEFELLVEELGAENWGISYESCEEIYDEKDWDAMAEIAKIINERKEKDLPIDEAEKSGEPENSDLKIENRNEAELPFSFAEYQELQKFSQTALGNFLKEQTSLQFGIIENKTLQNFKLKGEQEQLNENYGGNKNLYIPKVNFSISKNKAQKEIVEQAVEFSKANLDEESEYWEDFSEASELVDIPEDFLPDEYKKQSNTASIDRKILGPTTLNKVMAKPKEMVLDYLEMDIRSGADPKNTALVMAEMLRDKKLLTKFKGASEGLSIEEYAEIMSGVVVETQTLIDDGKLPETITENGVDRQTTIDDFINMTFDDTEILLSNLPERISGLTREEIAQLITEKVKEATMEQEVQMEEQEAVVEEVVDEKDNENNEIEVQQENETQEQVNQAEQEELAARLQQEQVAEQQVAKEQAEKAQEVAQQETALVADKDRTLMQKASAGIRNFFKEAKEKVGNFFEAIKEKFGGSSDEKLSSEIFAIDATKKNDEQKKKEEEQWQTIDGKESLKAAQEEAKRKAEEEKEKEPVSVGERDEK